MKRIGLLLLLAFVLTSSLHAQPAPPPANPGTGNCIAIRCPDDIRVWTCEQGAIVNYTVLATNHCGPSLLVECNPPSGSFFPTGTTQVDCRARDQAGNTAACSFKVSVVQDITAPQIICPPNLTNWVCSPNGGPVTFSATATDDCDTNVTIICDPPSGSNFLPGVTPVRCVAIDDCGNRDECRFLVFVRVDTEPPRILCPTNIAVWTCDDVAVVTYAPEARDDCDTNLTIVCVPPSGTAFPVGTHIVKCRAIDDCERTDECEFFVRVIKDTERPKIDCPGNITNWVCTPNGGPVTYTVTATDDCDPNVTIVCVPPSGSNFLPGATLVHCVATDDCGNRDECRFLVVTRVDTEPPRILCPTNIVVWTCDDRGLVVNYTVDAIDDCDTNVTITCEPPSGSLFPLGTHTVKCVAEDDCGRKSECAFQVRVILDLRPPEIRCPTNIIVFTCGDGERVRYEVEARDDCDTNVTIVCTPPSGSFFPVGTNEVRCVAFDDCGNRDECKFEIIVQRERSPRLTITRAVTHNGFIICWPAPSPGFRLQCTSSLNPPIVWQNVTNMPVLNGSDWCVTLRNEGRRRFYRLYKPCRPIITDVSHLRPRAGDVLTIKGSGFGFSANDLCVVIVPNNYNTTNPPPDGEFAAATAGDGTLYIPLRALSADGDSITALLGPVPPDVGPGKIMVGHGIGDEGRPRFQFDDIVLEEPIWVWRKFGPAGMGEQDIEPQPNPDPRERCFFSAAPENGELCVFIQGDWGTNCYVSITARAHDSQNDTGGYDLDGPTVRFIGGGTTRDCVARMAEIIRAAFEQQAGVIVDVAVDEVPPNSGVYKITVRIPGGYIDRGMLTICVRCPDLTQP